MRTAAIAESRSYPLACPYHPSSLVLYACGQLERAVIDADLGIIERERRPDDSEKSRKAFASALWAAASYHTDLAGLSGRMDADSAARLLAKAESHIQKALRLCPDHNPLIDTDGYVKIALASTDAEVEAALARSRQSWEAHPAVGGVMADTSTLFSPSTND